MMMNTLTYKIGSGHSLKLTTCLANDYDICDTLLLPHVGKITLLPPWANLLYQHEVVKSPSVDYTFVCRNGATGAGLIYFLCLYFCIKIKIVAMVFPC